jgi:LPXTG-motif cell wall-anchored protein
VAEQVSGQSLSSGAIGGGVSGLAALAALALLLLFRRKKKEVVEPAEETVETSTIDEDDAYISEYGLSDRDQRFDGGGEDDEDLPQSVKDDCDDAGSEVEAVSERNPDET